MGSGDYSLNILRIHHLNNNNFRKQKLHSLWRSLFGLQTDRCSIRICKPLAFNCFPKKSYVVRYGHMKGGCFTIDCTMKFDSMEASITVRNPSGLISQEQENGPQYSPHPEVFIWSGSRSAASTIKFFHGTERNRCRGGSHTDVKCLEDTF